MKTVDVIFCRIYLQESDKNLKSIASYLKKEANIRGYSIFRAVQGYGQSGEHGSSWADLSLALPMCIEFFDSDEKVLPAIEHLSEFVKAEHIVYWSAKANT